MNSLPKPLGVLKGADAVEWVERHKESLLKRCRELATPQNVLDPDEVRNILQLIGYNGRNVPEYKKAGNILVDELFKRQMSAAISQGNPSITFMSGIGGAGKGTALNKGGIDTSARGVVYDAAFNDMYKLQKKMESARDAGMTDIEVIVVHNDGLTAFKNTIARGRKIGRFLSVSYFLESYEDRAGLLDHIAKEAKSLGVNVTITPLDNAGNASRGVVDVEQAVSEWDYDPTHYIEDILKYLDYEIQQGGLKEDQIASIAGDISRLKEEWATPTVQRLARGIEARLREDAERASQQTLAELGRLGVKEDEAVPYGDISQGFGSAGTSLNQVPSATRKIKWEPGVEYQPSSSNTKLSENFENVPGVIKDHDDYVSVKEVEDYLDTLPNAYNVHGVTKAHPINSLESLKALKPILDQELYGEIKKRIYDPNVYGCRDSETGMIFVFTHKIWTMNHAEHNWWHENTHGAYDALELADKEECGGEAYEWLYKNDHMTQDQYEHYTISQRGSEGTARLIAYIFDTKGVNGILNGTFAGKFDNNEKIAKLAAAIQNYYKYGETREEESRNRLRQTSSSSDGRDAENGIDAPGRDRQGAIQSEKGSRAGEEIGSTQRGESIIDEVAEDGVGYGEADDSGISDEELEGYDAGRYSFAESITQGLVDLASKNAGDQQLRLNAMREFGGNLAKLRKIMNKQTARGVSIAPTLCVMARESTQSMGSASRS